MKIKIGSRFVGNGELAFIIAEADANHNRELGTAKIEKPWW
jgi:sialic acid synthase SpsE